MNSRTDVATRFTEELALSLRNDSLHLILLPTEKCNFRCTYCYEDFSVGRMKDSIVKGIKGLIDRRLEGLRSLSISWFGGEPLLALPVIEEVSAHVIRVAADHSDLEYAADMTTNGYLLDSTTMTRLSALGIRQYQISLDGPQKFHDRTRVQANGSGSFHQVWENLLAIRQSATPVHVILRVHITPANLSSMPEFLTHIQDAFLGDARFSVLLKPVERLGGPNDEKMSVIGGEEAPKILADLQSMVLSGGAGSGLQPVPDVCYAARPNSLMIRANGVVGKCTVALTDPANAIGRLRSDGTVEIDNVLLRPWLRGWESGDWSTLSCPANGLPRNQPTLLQVGPTRLEPERM
ncbi:radical SAM protein [Streptomyces luomodiensis]|uniref:Radical SAM protein n=1 Tax=Streptomyces luomodiensis TaxID=3026192 RepID=A0ABY9VGR4_9ACTN|nr:radical SAM protein [Streptomyces sp. SCA4-21]WNF01155.1 radical SAM protein [Streptomyces sp. SCA4-21]